MKKFNFILILVLLCLIISCKKSHNIDYLLGYWEINSVHYKGNELKNYPFSNTIDYFEFDENKTGFRKKVKPKINGKFDILTYGRLYNFCQHDFLRTVNVGIELCEQNHLLG